MLLNNDGYFQALENIKVQIQNARYRAVLGVNREQIFLYWNIGKIIAENQKYGSEFIINLARDIKESFPNATGYSARNFGYMQKFADTFPQFGILQEAPAEFGKSKKMPILQEAPAELVKPSGSSILQAVPAKFGKGKKTSIVQTVSAQLKKPNDSPILQALPAELGKSGAYSNLHAPLVCLSWTHLQILLDKIPNKTILLWYAQKTVENGWSYRTLSHQISIRLYERQITTDKASNFERTLTPALSELARDTLKNPYIFDFIEAREGIIEREIENELVANIAKTLIELGSGFAFVGNQYHLEVSGKDYYIDLLFYNTRLRSYVVIELKNTEFKPEYAGKLNFYLSAIDDILKHKQDNPTIGIMLCKERDKLTAEYALRDIRKPIGVSEYVLSDTVPKKFADILPTAEDIEKRIKRKYALGTPTKAKKQ